MGINCGFDILPRLDAGNASDRQAYREFHDEILKTYEDAYDEKAADGKVLELPARDSGGEFPTNSCIYFTVGEWPKMPANTKRCDYVLLSIRSSTDVWHTPSLTLATCTGSLRSISASEFAGSMN